MGSRKEASNSYYKGYSTIKLIYEKNKKIKLAK